MRTATIASIIALALLALLAGGCDGGSEATPEGGGQTETPSQEPPRTAEGTALPRLVDLGSGTCVPCKMMAPILEEMRVTFEGQLDVVFIDVREDGDAGREYGISVIPTQIFFDPEGNELYRHTGFYSREDMLAKWGELGYAFEG
jgi:thioredoxin 1